MAIILAIQKIYKRIITHNSKKVRGTKSRTSFTLHYHEIFQTKCKAFVREIIKMTILILKQIPATL